LDWQTFKVPEYGTRVEFSSEDLRGAVGETEKGVGQRFESDDGRAVLPIDARETKDTTERDGTVYYSRCNFSRSAAGSTLFRPSVSARGKRACDPVVIRISLSIFAAMER
jgi:hypothetical protein